MAGTAWMCLGKQEWRLVKNSLYTFAKILNQKTLGRRMGLLAAGLAGRGVLAAGSPGKYVF